MLQLNVFGTPSLWRDAQQLGGVVAQRRRLGLLCALAVLAPPGRPAVPRERLLELFWPTDDPERGRAALSQALYAIRRDLGDEELISGSATLRLDSARLRCDYWEFADAIRERADAVAADLRRGPLLDGFEGSDVGAFGVWVEDVRAATDRDWLAATERAARAAEARGDHARAIGWRRTAANVEPLTARLAIALAQALAAAGEREAALVQLRIHATLVRQELDAAPHPDVLALMDALQQAPPLPAPVLDMPIAVTPAAVSPPATTPEAPVPLVAPTPVPAVVPVPTEPLAPAAHMPAIGGAGRVRWQRVTALAAAVAGVAILALRVMRSDAGSQPVSATLPSSAPVFAVGDLTGDTLGRTVAAMLATNLTRIPGASVIGASRMLELRHDGAGSALRAAREAGATELLDGTLARASDGTWQVVVSRTAVQSGRVLGSARASGRDLFALVDRLTGDLLSDTPVPLPSDGLAAATTTSLDAWRLFEAGRRELTAGRRGEAVPLLRAALAADSTFALAALGLADALTGTHREYLPLLRQAVRMSERRGGPIAMWIRVQWLSAMNDPTMGAVLDTLARLLPHDLDVQMMRAAPALFERADFAEGTRVLEAVWRTDSAALSTRARPRCHACEATVHLVTVLTHADSLAAAERVVRRSLARRPTDGQLWALLAGVLERDAARGRDVRAAVDSAVRHGEPGARGYLLLAATRVGDTVEFSRALAQLLPTIPNPALTEAWARTLLHRNRGEYERALAWARRYAALPNPGSAEEQRVARTLEAAVLLDMGRAREAAAIWQAIAMQPRPEWTASRVARQQVFYRTLAATARWTAGDTAGLLATADSLAVLGVASGYARDRVLHHHLRGLAFLSAGQREEAIAAFRRAIVYPSMGFTRTNLLLASTLAAQGRVDEARQWVAAAARAPRDGSSLYQNPLAAARWEPAPARR